ncbi:MAG: DNA methyltransferase [Phycisphaerae bacterium]|nr:DNA methyltransferase [Phycisphaerae bacterium]
MRNSVMTTDPGDLVLDPTCGSGTTAYVAEQWGRRWITIDTSRVALALARTRLMAAKYPYYLLADSPEGIKKEMEIGGTFVRANNYSPQQDIRKGFVYRRVPHVTLKSIANNPDITEGMTREQIDAAIARHTETEMLYDQPYEDNKTVRVSGPFTVESLSPHRTISVEEKKRLAEVGEAGATMKMIGAAQFGNVIIENLRKAGVQNTVKNERLKFDRLEVHPGVWIHAEGEYTERNPQISQIDADEKKNPQNNLRKSAQSADNISSQSVVRRVAICIGPEHGTVGPELVKEAAKEAVQGIGFDLLLVCGFAFDPHVSEEAKRYGKLTVLPVRMNPDLSMGEELLKKTGAGNLFMVFGEPDVEIKRVSSPVTLSEAKGLSHSTGDSSASPQNDKREQLVVTIKGLDVYDPTTGAIRSSSTDDIACWFIDTNYNQESFFVRHAYFTGSDEPYEKLKRALRAEIDESAWSELYSTTSRPFDPPETGRIAVKVINHYGDEVLKIYETESRK